MPPDNLTILNVDDIEPHRYATTRALIKAGFSVVEAGAGREAMRLVDEIRPSLVLLDVGLPDMTGFEVCKWIKREHPQTFVLQLSASFTQSADRVRGLEGGADSYLTHPLEPEELIATVHALLRLRRAEQALRNRTAELESVLVSAPLGLAFFDREHRFTRVNEDLAALNGIAAADHIGKTIAELLPTNAKAVDPVLESVFQTGQAVRNLEISGETPAQPGILRHWLTGFYPIPDAAGRVASAGAWVTEITQRKQAEEALRLSEERLRLAFDAGHLASWDWDMASNRVAWSRNFVNVLNLDRQTFDGSIEAFRAMVHPDDRARVERAVQDSLAGTTDYATEFRIIGAGGALRWISAQALIIRDAQGRPFRMIGFASDITDRKHADEARQLLMRELNHRIKNLFALASGMVNTTARHSETPQDMADALTGRFIALARAHGLIQAAVNDDGSYAATALLGDLVGSVVFPHLTSDDEGQLTTEGPAVHVGPTAATSLALIMHELATNAVKYGALSVPQGRLNVSWRTDGDGLLLKWRETGGPLIASPPERRGFGSQLARMSSERQLGGSIAYDWKKQGVEITLAAGFDQLRR